MATASQMYNQLNSTEHLVYDYSLFIEPPVRDYWKLNDILVTVADPDSYRNRYTLESAFRASTPQKLYIRNPERMQRLIESNITFTTSGDDFNPELSRYACWTLMKQIGNSAIFQQEYFISPEQTLQTIRENAHQVQRIQLREDVKRYQSQLSGILKRLRISDYSVLNRNIVTWLFGNLNVGDLRYYYKISETKPLADHMNYYLLYAYATSLHNIIAQFDAIIGIRTYQMLSKIAYNESLRARNTFKHGRPEDNFEQSSVNDVVRWHKQREYNFAATCVNSR